MVSFKLVSDAAAVVLEIWTWKSSSLELFTEFLAQPFWVYGISCLDPEAFSLD